MTQDVSSAIPKIVDPYGSSVHNYPQEKDAKRRRQIVRGLWAWEVDRSIERSQKFNFYQALDGNVSHFSDWQLAEFVLRLNQSINDRPIPEYELRALIPKVINIAERLQENEPGGWLIDLPGITRTLLNRQQIDHNISKRFASMLMAAGMVAICRDIEELATMPGLRYRLTITCCEEPCGSFLDLLPKGDHEGSPIVNRYTMGESTHVIEVSHIAAKVYAEHLAAKAECYSDVVEARIEPNAALTADQLADEWQLDLCE